MKKPNNVYLILGLLFFILGITTKNYFYLAPAVLFILANFFRKEKTKSE